MHDFKDIDLKSGFNGLQNDMRFTDSFDHGIVIIERYTMLSVLLTILIALSYYSLLSSLTSENVLNKVIMSSVMTCAQIILSELLLGLSHNLYLRYIVVLNATISFVTILMSLKLGNNNLLTTIKHDINNIVINVRKSLDAYNIILGLLVFLAYGWILMSAYYLPIRGIDDLYYHLPPIFEYIQSHEIKLIPINVHTSFAFPENAELLFMWPTIFSSSQRMLNGLNVPFVLLSIATIYALLRHFCISRIDSFFASFLYALCPVIIMQSGTNYVDIIVSLFLLLTLYFALKFYDTQRVVYLYSTAVSIGLVCGMKYTAVFLTIPIQLMVIKKINAVNKRHSVCCFALIILLCGWWYVRNTFVLHDPLYPMNIFAPLLGSHAVGGGGYVMTLNTISANIHKWFLRYPLEDIGVGSFDGGFGLVFWGIGFPSWLYISVRSIYNFKISDLPKCFVLLQLPIGFLLLMIVPESNIEFASRFSIFVVAIGLFGMCQTINILRDKSFTTLVKMFCILFSIMTISLMSISNKPTYALGSVISDKLNHRYPSEYKYLMNSIPDYAGFRFIWEPLDYLTRDDAIGLNCFVAAKANLFITAPVFGSDLQNRVLNLHPQKHEKVDAYLYLYPNRVIRLLERSIIPHNFKVNDDVSIHDVLTDSNYMIVSHSESGCLIMHKSIINRIDKQELLRYYYLDTWPEAIKVANLIMPSLREHIPVVTSSHLGYGLRYLDYGMNKPNRVLMTLEGMEEITASKMKVTKCYTLDNPLTGYKYSKIANVIYNDKVISLYLNTSPNNMSIITK